MELGEENKPKNDSGSLLDFLSAEGRGKVVSAVISAMSLVRLNTHTQTQIGTQISTTNSFKRETLNW